MSACGKSQVKNIIYCKRQLKKKSLSSFRNGNFLHRGKTFKKNIWVSSHSEVYKLYIFKSIYLNQFSSVTQSCPTLCNRMDHSTPGFPVHHQLPKLAQTQVPSVSDAIQASHPLSPPSPHAFNVSQHQGLFQ